jgi:hypothetical protein
MARMDFFALCHLMYYDKSMQYTPAKNLVIGGLLWKVVRVDTNRMNILLNSPTLISKPAHSRCPVTGHTSPLIVPQMSGISSSRSRLTLSMKR